MVDPELQPCVVCGEVRLLDQFDKTCSTECSRRRAATWLPAKPRHLRLADKSNLTRGQLRVRSRARQVEGRIVGVVVDSDGLYRAQVLSEDGVVVLIVAKELELSMADIKKHNL